MDVTDVRIRLVESNNAEKLRAFATITLDREFVVRDMKIIEGNSGLFVAMPSRRIMTRCRNCGCKNPVRASYCNDCGKKLAPSPDASPDRRMKEHVDVAHPITQSCRDTIHLAVMNVYNGERQRARSASATPAAEAQTEAAADTQPESRPADETPAEDSREESNAPADKDQWGMFS